MKKSIKKWDILLLAGIMLSPLNTLRIWKIGPSELLCMIWCIKYFKGILSLNLNYIIKKFWIFFLISIFFGTCYGFLYYPNELDITGLITYLFFSIISIGIYIKFQNEDLEYIQNFIYTISILTSIFYFLLYLYSIFISKIMFGINLWYCNMRFAGGANNPHQLALLIGACLFFNLLVVFEMKTTINKKIIAIISIVFNVIVTIGTQSSTLYFSIFIATITMIFILIIKNAKTSKLKISLSGLMICVSLLFILLFYKNIYNFSYEWISSDENGFGRLTIFRSITYSLNKNFIIGLGPGTHAYNGTFEYHNTFLEIIAMSGIIGLSIFIFFSIELLNKIKKTPLLILPIIVIYIYGLGGFSARRLIFWITISLIIVWSEKINQNNKIIIK